MSGRLKLYRVWITYAPDTPWRGKARSEEEAIEKLKEEKGHYIFSELRFRAEEVENDEEILGRRVK
jgi:hypothetical protein